MMKDKGSKQRSSRLNAYIKCSILWATLRIQCSFSKFVSDRLGQSQKVARRRPFNNKCLLRSISPLLESGTWPWKLLPRSPVCYCQNLPSVSRNERNTRSLTAKNEPPGLPEPELWEQTVKLVSVQREQLTSDRFLAFSCHTWLTEL